MIPWVSHVYANGLTLTGLGESEDPTSAVRLDYLISSLADARTKLDEVEAALLEKIAVLSSLPTAPNNQKNDCLVAAVDNLNIAAGGMPIVQGKQLLEGDRVLLVGQVKAEENGLYVIRPGTWVRTYDANDPADFAYGMTVSVLEGDIANVGLWELTTPDPIALDKTPLLFVLKNAGEETPLVTPVEKGGTGATSAIAARKNLGCVEQVTFSPLGDGQNKLFKLHHGLNNDKLLEPTVLHLITRQYLKASVSCPNAGEIEVEFANPPEANTIAVVVVGVSLAA